MYIKYICGVKAKLITWKAKPTISYISGSHKQTINYTKKVALKRSHKIGKRNLKKKAKEKKSRGTEYIKNKDFKVVSLCY